MDGSEYGTIKKIRTHEQSLTLAISKIFKSNSIKVGGLIVCSRVLGLARDSLLANLLGAREVADAFYTAYRLPNMLRDLVAEGALSSIVVSRLAKTQADAGEPRTRELIRRLFAFWGTVLVLLSIAGAVAAPWLVRVMASGFKSSAQMELAITLTRLVFPYIAFVGLAALTMGILHHYRSFGWASIGSSCSNLTVIVVGLLLTTFYKGTEWTVVYFVALATVAGGLTQWLGLWPGLWSKGISIKPDFRLRDPEVLKVFLLIGPSVIGVAAVQINVAVNHAYASHLGEGAITAIYYAFRVMQLPVGIVGVAVSTVLLPTLAKAFNEKKDDLFALEMKRAMVSVSFLSLPAVCGILVLGDRLLAVLYEHGKFDHESTALTWQALQGYIIGILPYVYNKNLVQGYFARNDIRYTVRIALLSISINALANYLLAFVFHCGVLGLTGGTALVLWSNFLMLVWGMKRRHGVTILDGQFFKPVLVVACWSVLMSLALLAIKSHINMWGDAISILLLTVVGMVVFGSCWWVSQRFWRFDPRRMLG